MLKHESPDDREEGMPLPSHEEYARMPRGTTFAPIDQIENLFKKIDDGSCAHCASGAIFPATSVCDNYAQIINVAEYALGKGRPNRIGAKDQPALSVVGETQSLQRRTVEESENVLRGLRVITSNGQVMTPRVA